MNKSFQKFRKKCGKVIITAGLIAATTVSVYADNTALANTNIENGAKTKVEKVVAQDSKITVKIGKVKVGNSRLNVRNKASMSSKVIGKLYTGDKVEIIGENANWYKINYKGKTAYISKKYVSTSSTTVTEVEDCSDVFKAQIGFNVRTGPSTSYKKIGRLTRGQVLQVTGKCSNGWYQIKFGSKVGYISSKYLDAMEQGSKDSAVIGTAKVNTKSTKDPYLAIRAGQGTKTKLLDNAKTGDVLEILADKSPVKGWTKVRYNNLNGYAYTKWLEIGETPVVKDEAPVITSNDRIILTIGDKLNVADLGLKVIDKEDGDITDKAIVDISGVDTSKEGNYTVKVSVKDSKGNEATKSITIIVIEKDVKDEAPVITSKDSITINQGDKFAITDLELMVMDKEDGNITDKAIVDKSDVDTSKPGQYWVKVSVMDSHGNTVTKLIGVKVVEKAPVVKDEAPVITSKDSITINQGDKFAITDLELMVMDKEDGNITDKAIVDKSDVDTSKPGQYWVKVSVMDSHGNTVTKLIGVKVVEKAPVVKDEAPVITSNDRIILTIGDKLNVADLGLKVIDKEDGDITDKAIVDISGVDTSKEGNYTVKVSVKDSKGNEATKSITIIVIEKDVKNEAPVITSKNSITINQGDKFAITDLELVVMDKEDGNITDKAIVDSSDVDTSKPGKYWVKVSVKDSNGAQATKLIKVIVKEKAPVVKDEAPVITSKDSITLNVGDKLRITDLELVVTDKEDGNITDKAVIDKDGVDTSKAGTYEIKISVKDSHGNQATKTVKVIVKEKAPATKNEAPVITSKNSVTIKVGKKLGITDLDLKVTDKEDGDITNKATIDLSDVDTSKPGQYWANIVVSDSDGAQVTKLIGVKVVE